ncbi:MULTISPECIES: DMT family transporter [Bacillaceae]|uniref:EamA family transporter n=1 Tax=Evansella alkalicola TaxID=745819 RepID=A0ABS6JT29_9BACI|nr:MULTISPECIES: EamA family transporter [Bacillaceae]MBU9720839.1 EamA family transporter [Bacillus alkalicola]
MRRELGYVHIAVLLFGLSGLFAKWLTISAYVIVLGRVFFAAIFLWLVLIIISKPVLLPNYKNYLPFIFIGGVLAIHWGSFFHSIQISTVAIGLVTFATFPVFASLLEPIIFNEKYDKRTFVLATMTVVGVIFIVPVDLSSEVTQGVIWGLVSAVTFTILSILNRKYVRNYSSITVGFYQNLFAFFWLIPFTLFIPFTITSSDFSLLLLLGVLFTGVAHVVYIQGLSKVNVRSASIIASLEPVYGILAAIILLREMPIWNEWVGMGVILFSAMYISLKKQT